MADKTRMIGSVYGILIELKEDYELVEREETFEDFYTRKMEMLTRQAVEWIADDEELVGDVENYRDDASAEVDRENCEAL